MALAFVRHSDGATVDNGSTVVETAAQTLTAGNLLVVGVRSTVDIVSCSDTAGNTFTALTQRGTSGADTCLRIFYAANCLGHASNVVTAVSNNYYKAISADEFSGAALSSVFDAEVGGLTTTTTLSSPNLTTTNAADLVVVCAAQGNDAITYSAGSGYTLIDGTIGVSGTYFGVEYKIVSSIISGVAQTIVSSFSGVGTIAVAAFKEAVVASLVQRAGASLAAVHRASNF